MCVIKKIFNINYANAIGLYILALLIHPAFERILGGWEQYELKCGIGGYCNKYMCVDSFRNESWCIIEPLIKFMLIITAIVFLVLGIVKTVKSFKQKKNQPPHL